MNQQNIGNQFERLPESADDRTVEGRASRVEVIDFFVDRFDIPSALFESYTFWEKGKGKIWALRGRIESPVAIEALGIHIIRTRQQFWKPTTDGIQLLGRHAQKNVLVVSPDVASNYWAGENQYVMGDVSDGYVIVAQRILDRAEPLGVGLYLDGELRSVVPKARQMVVSPLLSEDGL